MAATKLTTALSILFFCIALFMPTDARPHRKSLEIIQRRGPPGGSGYLSAYSVPLNNGSTSLAAPLSTQVLKAIAIGRGTQNYTCAVANGSAPASIGASATLFDAGYFLQFIPPKEGQELLNILPDYFLELSENTLQGSVLPQLGMHYFNSALTPIFNMTVSDTGLMLGAKTGDIAAPASSEVGPNGQGFGAVDWLELAAKTGSVDLSSAFRVMTAGGKAPTTCENQPEFIEMQYAAQYWFYQ